MKLRIAISSFLVLLVLVYFYSQIPAKENNIQSTTGTHPTKFRVGLIDVGHQPDYTFYAPLNFNLWHKYMRKGILSNGRFVPIGWNDLNLPNPPNDILYSDISEYKTGVLQILSDNTSRNYSSYIDRPKIDMLTYAQRSDYQCEIIPAYTDNVDWWYAFDYHPVGEPSNDNGIIGRKCLVSSTTYNAGNVVSGLRANREQVDNRDFLFWDGNYDWYIKPRIKINVSDATHDKKVCNIKIRRYDGQIIENKDIDIYGDYFKNDPGGIYEGGYKEEFLFPDNNNLLKIVNNGAYPNGNKFNPTNASDDNCYMDIEIYWYKECDMWIDYVRVDNEWADRLFKHYYDDTWIEWEANQIANTNTTYNFFTDEAEYNMMPAIQYLNEKIHTYQPNLSVNSIVNTTFKAPILNQNHGIWYNRRDLSNEHIINNISKTKMNEVMVDIYPLFGTVTSMAWNAGMPQYIPQTLGSQVEYNPGAGVLGYPAPPAEYERNFDSVINRLYTPYLKQAKELAVSLNKPLHIVTTNQLYYSGDENSYSQREPTNEELDLLNNLAVSYSAKTITQYSYTSFGVMSNTTLYQRGLLGNATNYVTETSTEKRELNAYGQNKWQKVIDINTKLQKWGDYLVSFDESLSKSYNYHDPAEKYLLTQNSYFLEAATAKQGNGVYPCWTDDPQPQTTGLLYDCPDDRYLQIATFENPNETYPRYFMVINRRCSPVNSDPDKTGERFIRVRTKAGVFTKFNDWYAVDVETRDTFAFNSNVISYINICNPGDYNTWFKPGEGRLYHIVPKVTVGGTLNCDEYIQGGTLNIQDTIFTNGHTLRIGYGTTLNFSDSACIVVNGGSFICGDVSQPTHTRDIIFRGNSSNWSGITFNNCDTVNINSVQFQNVKGSQINNNYAVKLINCNLVNINNCTFTNADPQTAGAIEANFATSLFAVPNINVSGNTFTGNSSDKTALSIIVNGQNNIPVIIDNNTFTSSSNAATAMYLSFVTGTEISGNYISGYNKGIEMHYSSIDIIRNTFLSSTGNNNAKGIDAQDYSVANLSVNGSLQTGGLNVFDNSADNTNNIYVNNASFLLASGRNLFNITSDTGSYHLFGYFPGSSNDAQNNEISNCFKLNNVPIVEPNLPVNNVKWSDDDINVSFNFFSYYCEQNGSGDNLIVDYGNSVYDTITSSPYGESGGVSNTQTITPKKMYDSLCIAIRLKEYVQAKAKCYNLLNTYPDSTQGLNAVSKLYILAVTFDTSSVSANECKTFLNTLILNHPNNLPLVRKCNYYIQKCKVRLKEYQSAMTGFQQIIQQNPYSYEALLASWDYSATHLLDSLNGHSGGFSGDMSNENSEQKVEELIIPEGSERESFMTDYLEKLGNKLFSDDDKDKFTKEERKTISSSVVTALDDSKKKTKNHIETLTKKSEKGDSYAKVELKVMNTIKEVVKIKKPKTIFEHINSVNKDIQKLNTVKNETVKKVTNVVPTTYSLSQNYPNPFNPVTKINYELPKDGKVKLVIYDILGRQMKSLVNNEFKQAGRYTVEFNGTQFASGVYFYRIQVEDGKGYTAVKKMVLVK